MINDSFNDYNLNEIPIILDDETINTESNKEESFRNSEKNIIDEILNKENLEPNVSKEEEIGDKDSPLKESPSENLNIDIPITKNSLTTEWKRLQQNKDKSASIKRIKHNTNLVNDNEDERRAFKKNARTRATCSCCCNKNS
ncbi:PREDICTED: uncharacterized protein LOC108772087 [Cyphomyrmex costatus]|uniref:uncharacterized protein LOC108772087 n=1 Tax=Cyphomyrmex costatus TaxID=456900 RepID=UPI00085244EC|nr:PREDICTED: uncharacterized protein LOC108772087 [Cyphomyrmex costatus]